MKISVIGLRGFPGIQGGVEKHSESLYPLIAERGFEVKVFRRKSYINKENESKYFRKVRFTDLWTLRSKNLENIIHSTIAFIISLFERPDIIHIHNIGPCLLLPLLKFGSGKIVVTYHSPNYEHSKWSWFAKKILKVGERFVYRFADRVIFISKHQASVARCENKVYIPNGVNIPELEPPGDTLSGFNLESKRYFLSVGRLVPEKGFHDLIEAFAKLDTDWRLVIVGDADHEDSYSINLKKRADQVNGVIMTGFQNGKALSELYSNTGLFVLPSYHEGLPIVALEAMSYNLPILLSDIPANREVAMLKEIFPVGNVEELSNRLNIFIKNPSSLNSPGMLKEKRRRIETEFNWNVIAEQTAKLYREVIQSS